MSTWYGGARGDPFLLYDTSDHWSETFTHRQTAGRTPRPFTIDPTKRTEIWFGSWQSQLSNILPTLPVLAHASQIDNLSIYDGGLWDPNGPLLGCTYNRTIVGLGPGCILSLFSEKRLAAGKADHIIMVPTNVGNTLAADHGNGIHWNRILVGFARLAARGITPSMPGISLVGEIMMGGGNDNQAGTQQASVASDIMIHANRSLAAGVQKILLPQESYILGVKSTAVRAAQASCWNGTTILDGGDNDQFGSAYRTGDIHFNDLGGDAVSSSLLAHSP